MKKRLLIFTVLCLMIGRLSAQDIQFVGTKDKDDKLLVHIFCNTTECFKNTYVLFHVPILCMNYLHGTGIIPLGGEYRRYFDEKNFGAFSLDYGLGGGFHMQALGTYFFSTGDAAQTQKYTIFDHAEANIVYFLKIELPYTCKYNWGLRYGLDFYNYPDMHVKGTSIGNRQGVLSVGIAHNRMKAMRCNTDRGDYIGVLKNNLYYFDLMYSGASTGPVPYDELGSPLGTTEKVSFSSIGYRIGVYTLKTGRRKLRNKGEVGDGTLYSRGFNLEIGSYPFYKGGSTSIIWRIPLGMNY